MTAHTTLIGRALLLSSLCLPLIAADCPKGTSGHKGAWVSNQPDGVLLLEFEKDGSMLFAMEEYSPNPLIDGMKLEFHATCKPAEDSVSEQGRYMLHCTEFRLERATQGMAALFDSVSLLEAYLDDGFEEDDSSAAITEFEVKVEGDALTWFKPETKKRPAQEILFERVASHKVAPFMERFRVDTVELQHPTANRRERDLP